MRFSLRDANPETYSEILEKTRENMKSNVDDKKNENDNLMSDSKKKKTRLSSRN